MTRVANHLNYLNKVFDDNRHRPFKYGEWDCCIFAAEAVKATTGVNHIEKFIGAYSDLRTAVKTLRGYKGTLLKTVTGILGDPIPVAYAQRGDIAYHQNNLGVCAGRVAYFISDEGLTPLPMTEVEKVFGVR